MDKVTSQVSELLKEIYREQYRVKETLSIYPLDTLNKIQKITETWVEEGCKDDFTPYLRYHADKKEIDKTEFYFVLNMKFDLKHARGLILTDLIQLEIFAKGKKDKQKDLPESPITIQKILNKYGIK